MTRLQSRISTHRTFAISLATNFLIGATRSSCLITDILTSTLIEIVPPLTSLNSLYTASAYCKRGLCESAFLIAMIAAVLVWFKRGSLG